MTRLIAFLVVTAAIAALLVGASPATASSGECTFKGPSYNLSGKSGDLYNLSFTNVTCGFATPWARKLAGRPNAKPFYAVTGGPAGWNCNALAPGRLITSGACVKGTKRFGWSAA